MNGDLVGSKSLYSPKNIIRTKNYLGRSIWSDHDNFKGQMQDIRILDIDLDQEQILGLMNTSGFDWTYEFALALYKRTDATDTKLLDFSQYQNNGTMHR